MTKEVITSVASTGSITNIMTYLTNSVIIPVILYLTALFRSFMKAKVESIQKDNTLKETNKAWTMFAQTRDKVLNLVSITVDNAEQTLKKELKEKSADGKLTKEDNKAIFLAVKDDVLANLKKSEKEILEASIGDVSSYISKTIESYIHKKKLGINPI